MLLLPRQGRVLRLRHHLEKLVLLDQLVLVHQKVQLGRQLSMLHQKDQLVL
jgi:hypothetical protein